MVDWDAFLTKVRAAIPEGQTVPAHRFMVGVLRSRRDPNAAEFTSRDFVWVKANSKHTAAQIKLQYEMRDPYKEHVDLWLKGNIVPLDKTMRDLGTVGESLIGLCAIARPMQPGGYRLIEDRTAQLPVSAHNHRELHQLNPRHDREQPSTQDSARPTTFTQLGSETLKPSPYADSSAKGASSRRVPIGPGAQTSPDAVPIENDRRVLDTEYHLQQPKPSQIFDVDAVFDHDPSSKKSSEAITQPADQYTHEVIGTQDVQILEAGVARSMQILNNLKGIFLRSGTTNPDNNNWVQSIDRLSHSSQVHRTVIGVVGNTGAGKSSVINALLDEERLVPTNCMRACTTVVTEISWNHDATPEHRYRAEIEFVDHDEWDKEVNALMQEFLTENGTLVQEARDASSDSGIAWTKFHAVYPKIRGEDFRNHNLTAEKLMKESAVLNVLGTTKVIERARPEPFYHELQKYVDSKEKVTGKKSREQPRLFEFQMELWPLIKVVRLYTRSDALSTGAVVVDLPGVHDSNAARAAVAENYIKQCTGLWIVAPINRAVDDKAAQNLLGDTFKRQLKYDGNYSAVTFICSKTDDISIEDARIGLDLKDELAVLEEMNEQYENEIIETKQKIADLRKDAKSYRITLNEIEDEIEVWEELRDRVDDEEVFAPRGKTPKRKKGTRKKASVKRPRTDETSDYERTGSDYSGSTEEGSDLSDKDSSQTRLTAQVIDEKIANLKTAKKSTRQEMKSAEEQLSGLKAFVREKGETIQQLDTQIKALCIQGRNQYSKGAIQHDFAAGIRELDQEATLEADEGTFDPDEEIRDYEQIAESLPVFCVSSRAYQKLCGRLKRDDSILGFRTPQDTEIPQLQEHCKKLTEGRRLQAGRTFLLSLCQQLTALSLWASTDSHGREMTKADKHTEAVFLEEKLKDLDNGLKKAVAHCLNSMRTQLQEQVFQRMKELVNVAIVSAPTIAESWGRQKEQGGIHWSTYRAIVRRGGVYSSPHSGYHDFNAELLEPITKQLANRWERTFQQRLPQVFEEYSENATKVLRAFHERVEKRAHGNGASLAMLGTMSGSSRTYEEMFRDLNVQLRNRMTEAQRDANRDFVPTITNTMMRVYNICANERGAGSFGRMKSLVTNFVQEMSTDMFPAATDTVEQALIQMCRGLEQEMARKADTIFRLMQADYMRVLGVMDTGHDTLTSPDRSLRSEIMAQLEQMGTCFERLANEGVAAEDDSTEETTNISAPGHDTEVEEQLESASGNRRSCSFHDDDDDATNKGATTLTALRTINSEETMEDHGSVITGPIPTEQFSTVEQTSVNGDEQVTENDELSADSLLTNILEGNKKTET